MFEEKLENTLTDMGYKKMSSNVPGIYLYYYVKGVELSIVSILRMLQGTEVSREQYDNLLTQLKKNFLSTYPYRLSLLSLIVTGNPEHVRSLIPDSGQDRHWIIDLSANRLMIYETQAGEFAEMRNKLEEILEEEYHTAKEDKVRGTNGMDIFRDQKPVNRLNRSTELFTVMNSCVIAVNIIIYLITHYTSSFGGPKQMLSGGALSWYYVFSQKQYYRVLTAMFMHSNISHLFNNMLVLLIVGVNLERAAGKFKYLLIYFGTGILAGITSISYNMWKDYGQFSDTSVYSIGASGAIFGVVGAVLFIVIINRGRLENINTRQMVLFVIFSLYGGIANTQIDQAAHIGGFAAGILLAALLYRRPGGHYRRRGDST